jgi:hypothetical protein
MRNNYETPYLEHFYRNITFVSENQQVSRAFLRNMSSLFPARLLIKISAQHNSFPHASPSTSSHHSIIFPLKACDSAHKCLTLAIVRPY